MQHDHVHMLDILESARLAVEYLQGIPRDVFLRDIRLQDSVVRRIEILGEAARRVSMETQRSLSQIPWAEMISMRNFLIHEYDDIDPEIVFATVRQDLPALIDQLEMLLESVGH